VVFVFGTLFGSFINVCIARLPTGKSIVWPGSACGSCGVPLAWWQNLPVISWLALRGRCHWCHERFSIRYLMLEVLTGGITVALFSRFGASWPLVYYFVFSALLVIVFFIDLDAWIILDEVNYFGIAAGILGAAALAPQYLSLEEVGLRPPRLVFGPFDLANCAWAVAGAVVGWLFFTAIAYVGAMLARQEAMGQGDVKFAAMIGAFLGPQNGMLAMLLAFPLGALFAVPLILLRRKSGKTPVPFGTFMAVAAFITVIVGDRLVEWVGGVLSPYPLY